MHALLDPHCVAEVQQVRGMLYGAPWQEFCTGIPIITTRGYRIISRPKGQAATKHGDQAED